MALLRMLVAFGGLVRLRKTRMSDLRDRNLDVRSGILVRSYTSIAQAKLLSIPHFSSVLMCQCLQSEFYIDDAAITHWEKGARQVLEDESTPASPRSKLRLRFDDPLI